MSPDLLSWLAAPDIAPGPPDAGEPPAPGDKRFVRIPLTWIQRAACLPGRTSELGLVLWFLAGVGRTQTVRLRPSLCAAFGVDRHAAYRAIAQLESAGLVSVDRKRGRAPIVTLHAVGGQP
jgi:hypothetical protein